MTTTSAVMIMWMSCGYKTY